MQTLHNIFNQHRDGPVQDRLAGTCPSSHERLTSDLSASLMNKSVHCLPISGEQKISYASDLDMT